MLRFTILGSGSSGNSAYLETEHSRVLIDAGFSAKQIEARLALIGRRLEDIEAVFVTHEHGDHVCGLARIAQRTGARVFANRLTAECLRAKMPESTRWEIFDTGETVRHGDLEVGVFAVPHDAYDPVGFVFHHACGRVGFLTDLGYATRLVLERIRGVRALVLEANHDLAMIQQDTKRPWSVKQRILSRHGHLSNAAAAAVAAEVACPDLEDIFLGHLSGDCNSPELARAAVAAGLAGSPFPEIRLHDTHQDQPCSTLAWT